MEENLEQLLSLYDYPTCCIGASAEAQGSMTPEAAPYSLEQFVWTCTRCEQPNGLAGLA